MPKKRLTEMNYEIPVGEITTSTLVLASKSPRRRELMRMLELPYAVIGTETDETIAPDTPPDEIVSELSRRKCAAAAELYPDNIVIGADTIVWNAADAGRCMYGKPADHADAVRMLSNLSGRSHQVYTGVTVMKGRKTVTAAERTDVRFRVLTQAEIERYISEYPPYDKAGAYAIQERAALFVSGIDGCFYNVIGLPVSRLARILRDEFGLDI